MGRRWTLVAAVLAAGAIAGYRACPGPAPAEPVGTSERVEPGARAERAEGVAPLPDAGRAPVAPDALPGGAAAGAPAPAPPASDDAPFVHRYRVVRGETAVPGCEVRLLERGAERARRTTDAEGRFALPEAQHMGAMVLEIRTERSVLRTRALPRTRPRLEGERVFRLGHCQVDGRVWTADGGPHAGAAVHLSVRGETPDGAFELEALADGAGRVHFVDLPPGSIDVHGRCAAPNALRLTLEADGREGRFELGPSPDARPFEVRVLCPDGTPAWTTHRFAARSLDDPSGPVVGLERAGWPEGPYRATLHRGRYALEGAEALLEVPASIQHGPGSSPLVLRVPGAVVRGLVEDHAPRWEGMASELSDSTRDLALRDAASGAVVATTRVRDSGRFELVGVPPGSYVLSGAEDRRAPPLTRVPVTVSSASEVPPVVGLRTAER